MIEFLKIRDVKSPKRNFGDAGIDLFVPELNKQLLADLASKNSYLQLAVETSAGIVEKTANVITEDDLVVGIIVRPQQAVLIPMGVKSKFGPNIALMANNKSGVATKKQLIYGAQLVDSSYQGEIHANMINTGTIDQIIKFGDKIIQFVPVFIDYTEIGVTDVEEGFYSAATERGEGGFGSTGTN